MDTEKRIKKVVKSPRYGEVWNEPKAPSKKFIPTTVKNVRRKSLKMRALIHFLIFAFSLIAIRAVAWSYVGLENLVVSQLSIAYHTNLAYLAEKAGYSTKPVVVIPEGFSIKRKLIKEMKVNGLSPALYPIFRGQIRRESQDNPYAESIAGAKGLMQLIPETTVKCGMKDPKEAYDVNKNIECGVWWNKEMLKSQNYDIILALKEFNSGKRRIDKTEENRNYPKDVFDAMLSLPAAELIWED